MSGLDDLKQMSPQDFLALGSLGIAYIRPVSEAGAACYAVHTDDGSQAGLFDNEDEAIAAVLENGLEPVSIH